MKPLPTCRAADLHVHTQPWLIQELWGEQAVGILGGEPKTGKSILGLELAVAVASGRPCMDHFVVEQPGPVLLFPAEDAADTVRSRLEAITTAAGVDLQDLDLHIIDVPVLRLDLARDRDGLNDTVAALRPRLLILDPLVRLHQCDENAVSEIAPMLAWLRQLQRLYQTAVLLVHHARKGGASRPGQALRGSSELHAWGASNLYLRRKNKAILLTVEHRNAPACPDMPLQLIDRGAGPIFRLKATADHGREEPADDPQARICTVLAEAGRPLTRGEIRTGVQMRNATFGIQFNRLLDQGRITRNPHGFVLADRHHEAMLPGLDPRRLTEPVPVPVVPRGLQGTGTGTGLPLSR